MSKGSINNIVVFSDTHVGCKLALCHPDGAELDEGGFYKPSKLQNKIWSVWREFWDKFVPAATHGEPFAVVHNGDVIDGVHHNSTTQWSHNVADQRRHAEQILKPVVDACEGRYYHVSGTEAHVGQSATEEEQLARSIGAIKGENGRHARWELLKKIGSHTVHFSHHIGTTASAAHETSAVNAELSRIFTSCGRWQLKPPSIVVRSHRHQCCEIRLPSAWGYAVSMVTPAWQFKTPFVYRTGGGRDMTGAQIGGSLIRLDKDGHLYTRHFVTNVGAVEAE